MTLRPDPVRPNPVRRPRRRGRRSGSPGPPRYVLGLDLGQAHDYTALCVAERTASEPGAPPLYEIRHIDRAPLGTPYPDIVTHVARLMGTPELSEKTRLVVDGTGVGRPVVDLLWHAKRGAVDVPNLVNRGRPGFRGGPFRHAQRRVVVGLAEVEAEDVAWRSRAA